MREDGIVAIREYQAVFPDGTEVRVAFTLGDMTHGSSPARFARETGAIAYGLICIEGAEDAPKLPAVWTQYDDRIAVTVSEGDDDFAEDLRRVIMQQLMVFFADLADVAPELSKLKLRPRPPDGRPLH
jgi:hypothetical protein